MPTGRPFDRFGDKPLRIHTDIHTGFAAMQSAVFLFAPIGVLTFPAGQIGLRPETRFQRLLQDDQYGIAGSDQRLFFKGLTCLGIALGMFRPR